VRAFRKQRKWTQQILADKIGMTRASIANIESGRYATSIETLVNLARAFRVSAVWLISGTDHIGPDPIVEADRLELGRLRDENSKLAAWIARAKRLIEEVAGGF
jgi:putative transcriptional regulator